MHVARAGSRKDTPRPLTASARRARKPPAVHCRAVPCTAVFGGLPPAPRLATRLRTLDRTRRRPSATSRRNIVAQWPARVPRAGCHRSRRHRSAVLARRRRHRALNESIALSVSVESAPGTRDRRTDGHLMRQTPKGDRVRWPREWFVLWRDRSIRSRQRASRACCRRFQHSNPCSMLAGAHACRGTVIPSCPRRYARQEDAGASRRTCGRGCTTSVYFRFSCRPILILGLARIARSPHYCGHAMEGRAAAAPLITPVSEAWHIRSPRRVACAVTISRL
jgi:hypothetical protein